MASVAGPQLFHVCHSWRKPVKATDGCTGWAMVVAVAVEKGVAVCVAVAVDVVTARSSTIGCDGDAGVAIPVAVPVGDGVRPLEAADVDVHVGISPGVAGARGVGT